MKGRKPVAAEERRRRNPRFKDLPNVIAGRARPEQPEGLTEQMAKAWTIVLDDLERAGVLDAADWPVVEAFCVAIGRAREARAVVNEEGLTFENTRTGAIHAHPAVSIEREALKEARLLADNLPLSPWGRRRLGIKTDRSDFDEMKNQLQQDAQARLIAVK